MDPYTNIPDYVSKIPFVQSWSELQAILAQITLARPKHWILPIKACLAVGGTEEQAFPAVAAIACIQIGIVLLDDMLDHDPRGEYHRLGPAVTANLAAAFQFTGLEVIFRHLDCSKFVFEAVQHTNQMLLEVGYGQQMDLHSPVNEADYWQVVRNKSGSFFGTALELGALLGEAPSKTVRRIKRFGELYGEMIQIHDDLSDVLTYPAGPDWMQKRTTLPILFAQQVSHPEREHFLRLCQEVTTQPEIVSEAQDILIRSGAISYCIDQLLQRYALAIKTLDQTPMSARVFLEKLLDEIMLPVWRLFDSIGSR